MNDRDRELSWFYLAFTDPHKAPGYQFLGACFVPGANSRDAIQRAHNEHCHPGDVAEVISTGPISELYINNKVPPALRCVLLTKEQMTEGLGWQLSSVYRH
jgi:hypothetical protein